MKKLTLEERKTEGEKNIERYCEFCGNFDGDWSIGVVNGPEVKGKNVNCKECTYLAPSGFFPVVSSEMVGEGY